LIPLTSMSCILCNNVAHWQFAGIDNGTANASITCWR
jgi:hypothetical protein